MCVSNTLFCYFCLFVCLFILLQRKQTRDTKNSSRSIYTCDSSFLAIMHHSPHPGFAPGQGVVGRSPREGNGNPLQCSCLENPMDGGAWQATVHGVAKSRTWLSNFIFTFKGWWEWRAKERKRWWLTLEIQAASGESFVLMGCCLPIMKWELILTPLKSFLCRK